MTECGEVAGNMLATSPMFRSADEARAWVKQQMPDEGMTIRENIAWSLWQSQQRRIKMTKPFMYGGALFEDEDKDESPCPEPPKDVLNLEVDVKLASGLLEDSDQVFVRCKLRDLIEMQVEIDRLNEREQALLVANNDLVELKRELARQLVKFVGICGPARG